MQTLISRANLQEAIDAICAHKEVGLDTETYGLRFNDRLFSFAISTINGSYYFNFNHNCPFIDNILDIGEVAPMVQKIFNDPSRTVFIHNAKFDMKTIQARRKIHGLAPMKRFPVLDTVKIARLFFVPALIATENSPEAKKMLDGLLAKTKYKSYTVSLGKLASVLGVTMDKWHDAKADVQMLMEVLQKIIEFLKQNVDLDITKQKASQAKRYRNSPF
jgi:DNA polymerase III epsilon subunit-like protein